MWTAAIGTQVWNYWNLANPFCNSMTLYSWFLLKYLIPMIPWKAFLCRLLFWKANSIQVYSFSCSRVEINQLHLNPNKLHSLLAMCNPYSLRTMDGWGARELWNIQLRRTLLFSWHNIEMPVAYAIYLKQYHSSVLCQKLELFYLGVDGLYFTWIRCTTNGKFCTHIVSDTRASRRWH